MKAKRHTPGEDYSTSQARWQAVKTRDHQARDCFVYAVKTTGVYCRPGCSSRLPNRENVVFFANAEQAHMAGFRPCLRCRPEQNQPGPACDQRVLKACRIMEESTAIHSLAGLASAVGLGGHHFQRLFKKHLGITPKQYAAALRLGRLRACLQKGQSVTQAIHAAGFGSSSRLYEGASQKMGMEPSRLRDGGQGARVYYAILKSRLGWMLVAATINGVCAIELGEDPQALTSNLEQSFPRASLEKGDDKFADWVREAVATLETSGEGKALPLDIQGTAFQKQVWDALQEVPPGQTITYGELASQLGKPKAARAVANACAGNRLAVAVPCHRVIRGDGKLGGYRWGLEKKADLLAREAKENKPGSQGQSRKDRGDVRPRKPVD